MLCIDIFNVDNELVCILLFVFSVFEKCVKGNEDVCSFVKFKYFVIKVGYNEFVWDFWCELLNCIENVKLFGGWNGVCVMFGDYKVKIIVGE